jgi:chorismate synthase
MGTIFRVTSFGESHGNCIGVIVDGCPAGLKLDLIHIQEELNRRRPGQSKLSTSRDEKDRAEILSGVFKGKTTGAPICMIIWNKDRDSSMYEEFKWKPRPGHADYTAQARYGGHNDYRGSGRFSGRITASYVMAGAIAKQLLRILDIEIIAYTKALGGIQMPEKTLKEIKNKTEINAVRCPDLETAEKMVKAIEKVKKEGDSLGGVVECVTLGVPVGLGQPIFDNLESDLSKALFSIPAVKAVEFGEGILAASLKGSENNDQYILNQNRVISRSNNTGGIIGGISNGMPIKCRVFIKPTPSIFKKQKTVNLETWEETTLQIKGRHDPSIVPRAVPVVENVIALVMTDHVLRAGLIPQVLVEKE